MGMSLKKVTNFLLGVEEDYDDEYEDDEYYEEEDVPMNRSRPGIENIPARKSYSTLNNSSGVARGSAREVSNVRTITPISPIVTDLHSRAQIDISFPRDIDSAREVIDNVKSGIYSIVNLETVDSPLAQRIADFLSGAVDALDGNIRRLSNEMFIITPAGVEITGDLASDIDETLKSSSGINLSWLSSTFK